MTATMAPGPITLDGGPAPKPDAELIVNGRYAIPDPITGEKRTWQRATNFANALDSGFALERWKMRQTLRGIAAPGRDHLLLEIAAAAGKADTHEGDTTLDRLAEAAQEAAGATSKRQKGTALHDFVERINRGEEGVTAPGAWAKDLDAYRREVTRIGLEPLAVELVVVNLRYGVAGRADLFARLRGRDLPVVADLKTGSINDLKFAVQMAVYGTAEWIFDPVSRTFMEMPALDQQLAVLLHLPEGEAECTSLRVDLQWAIELADLALAVREARSGLKGLVAPLADPVRLAPPPTAPTPVVPAPAPPEPEVEPPTDRTDWVRQRLTQIAHSTEARAVISTAWPDGVPATPPWSPEQLEEILPAISEAERAIRAPFPTHDDPEAAPLPSTLPTAAISAEPAPRAPDWDIVDDGAPADADELAAIGAGVTALQDPEREALNRWVGEAKRSKVNFAEPPGTARTAAICLATLACATGLWDDTPEDHESLVRAALALTLWPDLAAARTLPPSWETGAVLGHLDRPQALRLAEIAEAYGTSSEPELSQLAELVVAALGDT